MKLRKIEFKNEGYVHCKSRFYSSEDLLNYKENYLFCTGINKLYGEIDSGIWAVSYVLSMYKSCKVKKVILFKPVNVIANDEVFELKDIMKYSCYMDTSYPLFSRKKTVKKMIKQGLKKYGMSETPEEIRDLFKIDSERFERPLSGVGNEIFRAMAAIGYCNKKQIYCFPWLSKMRYENYHGNITNLLDILNSLEMIVIVPIGK